MVRVGVVASKLVWACWYGRSPGHPCRSFVPWG